MNKGRGFQYIDAACLVQSNQKTRCILCQYLTSDKGALSNQSVFSQLVYGSAASPFGEQAVLAVVPVLRAFHQIVFHAAQGMSHPFRRSPSTASQDFYKKLHRRSSSGPQWYILDNGFQFLFSDAERLYLPNTEV